MKRLLASILFLSLLTISFAQMSEDDEVTYQSAIDWLDSKLNYVYYDDVSGKWWNNTFYVNDKKEVTIKHISSDKPNTANINQKNYTIRTFSLADINPYDIIIREEEDSRGRIVKGKVLEIRTFGREKSIHKKINTRRGSSTSFLFFSFPEFLNDSIADYAQVVKSKLTEAIISSTKVYASSYDENIKKFFNTLSGSFKNEKGETWESEQIFPNTLKITTDPSKREFFGYDSKKKLFYHTSISNEELNTIYYKPGEGYKLLVTEIDGSSSIIIETQNSFKINGVDYFRQ